MYKTTSKALCTVKIKFPTKVVFRRQQNRYAEDDNINIKVLLTKLTHSKGQDQGHFDSEDLGNGNITLMPSNNKSCMGFQLTSTFDLDVL